MDNQISLTQRLTFTAIATSLVGIFLAWDYYHGGVPTHHLMQRADMPGLSNWWGIIVLPVFSWLLLIRINSNLAKAKDTEGKMSRAVYGFVGALIVGMIFSFFFEIGTDIPGYLLIVLFVLSFFNPLFKASQYLGFVIGMMYTFGVMLPVFIGGILVVVFFITFHLVLIIKSKFSTKG